MSTCRDVNAKGASNMDGLVESAGLVMPDLIRYPEYIENTKLFRHLPEWRQIGIFEFSLNP